MRMRTWSVLGKGTGEVTSARLSRTDASGKLTLPTAPTLTFQAFLSATFLGSPGSPTGVSNPVCSG